MLVSVLIPVYNAEKYIVQTLESVLNQTYKTLEIIAVDDGSTDDSLKILRSFESRGIKVLSQSNKGQCAAFNRAIGEAKGDYIKFLDADDLISSNCIELQIALLQQDKDYLVYGEWGRFFDDNPDSAQFQIEKWIELNPVDFLVQKANLMIGSPLFLMSRDLLFKAGLWDERLGLNNDLEFCSRLVLTSKGVRFSQGAKYYYRSGNAHALSAQRSLNALQSAFLAANLFTSYLLKVENNSQTRLCCASTFKMMLFDFYPQAPDLVAQTEAKIKELGGIKLKYDGGRFFRVLQFCFGWKKAKRIKLFFYQIGYANLLVFLRNLHPNKS